MMTVEHAARLLLVTPRRVRAMLMGGFLGGSKDFLTGRWMVAYPLNLKIGKRGPKMRYRRKLKRG